MYLWLCNGQLYFMRVLAFLFLFIFIHFNLSPLMRLVSKPSKVVVLDGDETSKLMDLEEEEPNGVEEESDANPSSALEEEELHKLDYLATSFHTFFCYYPQSQTILTRSYTSRYFQSPSLAVFTRPPELI